MRRSPKGERRKTLLGKRLLFITAHPDDESYLMSGTIWKNHLAGGKNFILCATNGERGKSHLPVPATPGLLRRIRRLELETVSLFLRVDRLVRLVLPDARLTAHSRELVAAARRLARDVRPQVIVGFGEDGITGHRDHIIVGRIARQVAAERRLPFCACTVDPRFAARAKQALAKRRRHGSYAAGWTHPKPNMAVTVDPRIKLRAILMHGSQIEGHDPFAGLPRRMAAAALRREHFVWYPPRARAAPVVQ